MKREFGCMIEQRQAMTSVWRLSGDFRGTSDAYAFQEKVREAVAGGGRKVVLDLAAVDRIDSSAVGILMACMWSAHQAGSGLVLASLPPKVERVLGIAMILDHVSHAATVDDALVKLEAMQLGS